jgi:hypothetical protein
MFRLNFELCAMLCVVLSSGSFVFASGQNAQSAREWKRVPIDGAVCGDGGAYSIFVSPGDPRKIAFDMMGGGGCWSASSCFVVPEAWIHPIPGVFEKSGFVSRDPEKSPVSGFTLVYFPYCTADVHLGTHVADYGPGLKVHHVGALNFQKTLAQILKDRIVDLPGASDFVMMGYSAGAIGAMLHVLSVEPHVRNARNKALILDAPGLHFGKEFWEKFTPEWVADISNAMAHVGMSLTRGHGNMAGVIPRICGLLPDWRVAVLQGSRDIIMSKVFGSITQEEHEALIYGPEGLYALTENPNDNCAAWVPSSPMHTFMFTDAQSAMTTSDGKSAMSFVRDATLGLGGTAGFPNHR